MSMIRCDLCDTVVDSDDYPEGFYVATGRALYVCETCWFNGNLEKYEQEKQP